MAIGIVVDQPLLEKLVDAEGERDARNAVRLIERSDIHIEHFASRARAENRAHPLRDILPFLRHFTERHNLLAERRVFFRPDAGSAIEAPAHASSGR